MQVFEPDPGAEDEPLVVPPEDAGTRLDAWLAAADPDLSRTQAQRAIEEGRVRVDGEVPKKAGVLLRGGEIVSLASRPPTPSALTPEPIPLTVVHADDHLVVIDKPAGLVVHPGAGHETGTLVHGLLHWARERGVALALNDTERPGIVHRIDKDTSGLLVVALTEPALIGLQRLFAAHDLDRLYRAVLLGRRREDAGTIRTTHARDPRDRRRFTGRQPTGRHAVTHWRTIAAGAALTLVECRLETGRTHQIRVHMSESGTPIVADPIYGSAPPAHLHGASGQAAGRELAAARAMPRLALHAAVLGFRHPVTGELLRFEAADPPDLAALVAAIPDEV